MNSTKLASPGCPLDRRTMRWPRASLLAGLVLALAPTACTVDQSLGALGGTGGAGAGGKDGTGGGSPTDGSPGDALSSCPGAPGAPGPSPSDPACVGSFSCSYGQ